MKTENLTKATHDAEFLCGSLRDALTDADAVAALALLPLIERAAGLMRDLGALRAAVAARGAEQ